VLEDKHIDHPLPVVSLSEDIKSLIHDFPSSERRGMAALQEGSREHCTKLFNPLSFFKHIDDLVTLS
jgi:hypothetical protein